MLRDQLVAKIEGDMPKPLDHADYERWILLHAELFRIGRHLDAAGGFGRIAWGRQMSIGEINGIPLSKIAEINGTPLSQVAAINGMPFSIRVLRNLELRPNGPFFRFVVTYLVASAGLTPVYDAAGYPGFMAGIVGHFPGAVQGDLQANLAECVAMARDGKTLPQLDAEVTLCCMLANSAYESLPDSTRKALQAEPAFELFRHVRNAASHGNTWHFFPQEPKRPARWDPMGGAPIAIDHSLLGNANPLQGKQCFYGTLQPADLLYLLRDIEKLVVALGP